MLDLRFLARRKALGAVAVLTMALALSTRGPQPQYELPEERVMIG